MALALPENVPRRRLAQVVHRLVRSGYDPLSIEGSLRGGGRYNPGREFGALYTSFDERTAAAEVLQRARIDPSAYPEGFYWDYELAVELEAVLDLTDAAVLSSVRLTIESLTGTDWAVTQGLARKAREAGFQGILVPSVAQPGSKNLVIFLDKLEEPPRVVASRPIRF